MTEIVVVAVVVLVGVVDDADVAGDGLVTMVESGGADATGDEQAARIAAATSAPFAYGLTTRIPRAFVLP